MEYLEQLIYSFSRLPGIGKKSAVRLVYHLLQCDNNFLRGFGKLISTLPESIQKCSNCGNYSDQTLCSLCRDTRRDNTLLCVVEQPQEISVIEASHEYNGYYHVLHGVIAPLNGVGPSDLNIASLAPRVEKNAVEELIIATNPTVEGDATALYIKKLFENSNVRVTRLALGLPVGGDLEYADRLTLARSLRGRIVL